MVLVRGAMGFLPGAIIEAFIPNFAVNSTPPPLLRKVLVFHGKIIVIFAELSPEFDCRVRLKIGSHSKVLNY